MSERDGRGRDDGMAADEEGLFDHALPPASDEEDPFSDELVLEDAFEAGVEAGPGPELEVVADASEEPVLEDAFEAGPGPGPELEVVADASEELVLEDGVGADSSERITTDVEAVRDELASGSWSAAYPAVDAADDIDPNAFDPPDASAPAGPLSEEALSSPGAAGEPDAEEEGSEEGGEALPLAHTGDDPMESPTGPMRTEAPAAGDTVSAETPAAGNDLRGYILRTRVQAADPAGDEAWLRDHGAFRDEGRRLARAMRWRDLASLSATVAEHADFAVGPARAAILLDLARLYRDRLRDEDAAAEAFEALLSEDAAQGEALDFLADLWRRRQRSEALFALALRATESAWDPDERLRWTREAASVALEDLGQPALAIRAWEQLWELGDAALDAGNALASLYRMTGRWTELASFLTRQAERMGGGEAALARRELAEVQLHALVDLPGARRTLESLVALRGMDAVSADLLVQILARSGDWEGLEGLADAPATSTEEARRRALRIARALEEAGEDARLERALDRMGRDAEAQSLRRALLERQGRHAELAALLEGLAEALPPGDPGRVEPLREAARLRHEVLQQPTEALRLWQALIEEEGERRDTLEAVAALQAEIGAQADQAETLEGLLRMRLEPLQRAATLMALAQLRHELGERDAALEALSTLLRLEPDHVDANALAMELHREAGDNEALQAALERNVELATSDAARLEARIAVAEHLDSASDDAERSLEAWLRVLDEAPEEGRATARVATLLAATGRTRVLCWWLAARAATIPEERSALLDKLAGELAEMGDVDALLAAAEVRYAIERSEPALDALLALLQREGRLGLAREVLQAHARASEDRAGQVRALSRLLSLLPDDDHRERLDVLRALWCLGERGAPLRDALVGVASALGCMDELEWMLRLELGELPPGEERAERAAELARLLEDRAGAPLRAFVLRQAEALDLDALVRGRDELLRLAQENGRHEDALAILARLAAEPAHHEAAMRDYVRICCDALGAPQRALWALHIRALESSGEERAAFVERFEALARAHEARGALAALWHDLSFLEASVEARARHVAAEHALRSELGEDAVAEALMQVLVRLQPRDGALRERFFALLDERGNAAWVRRLPLLEGVLRSGAGEDERELALIALADLYRERAKQPGRALDLAAEALLQAPRSERARERVVSLGQAQDAGALSLLLRLAAARVDDLPRRAQLLEGAIELAREADSGQAAVELTRRLHALQPENADALRALVDAERVKGDPHTLRRLLRRLMLLEKEPAARVAAHLEIADLCADALEDREGAFASCAAVLESDPDHEGARERLAALMKGVRDPVLQLRYLQLQLSHAEGEGATKLQLEMAELQESALQDPEGAADTLLDLLAHAGAVPEAVKALRRLLPEQGRHAEHAGLLADLAAEGDREALDELLSLLRIDAELLDADRVRALLADAVRTGGEVRHWRALGALELSAGEGGWSRLGERLEHAAPPAPLAAVFDELLRLLRVPTPEVLKARWEGVASGPAPTPEALWGLAALAAESGDLKAYTELRARAARLLNPSDAALHFCHLAELAQEKDSLRGYMVSWYREARGMDPENPCAREALRGIGRRLRSLRPAAALLPEQGEMELGPEGRAARLLERAQGAVARGELVGAAEEVRRSLAVDPDCAAAWALLAEVESERKEPESAAFALRQALEADVRTSHLRGESPNPELLASRIRALARAGERAASRGDWRGLAEQAWLLAPHNPEATLVLCRALLADGEERELLSLLEGEISANAEPSLRAEVLALRGRAQRQAGRDHEAEASLRAALAASPLHLAALGSLAELLHADQAVGSALELHLRALAVEPDPEKRALHYHQAGRILEDGLALLDEAGAAFEHALRGGLESRDLQQRVLRHCMRNGQRDRALVMVESLLPGTRQPDELSELWLVRGRILSEVEGCEAEAIEAFDMALSYDPARNDVRLALAEVIERRGDWSALLELLEAIAEGGAPEESASALLRMATIAEEHLEDLPRAEAFLRRSVEGLPTAEGVERLVAMVGYDGDPALVQTLRARQVEMGPPWYAPAQELGRLLLHSDAHRAWCLLAPAMLVREVDDALRTTLRELRRTHERPLLLVPGSEGLQWLEDQRATGALDGIFAVLGEALDEDVLLGPVPKTGERSEISPHAALGRAFAGICSQLGLEGLRLMRDETQRLPLRVARSAEGVVLGVRPDMLPHLTRAEVGFALVSRLFLVTRGRRVATLAGPARRSLLIDALWQALDLHEGVEEAVTIADAIRASTSEERRTQWAEQLGELADQDAASVAQRWWSDLERDARLCGIVAGADLLQIWRLYSVMYEGLDRPMAFQTFEALDEWVGTHPELADLLIQVASDRFSSLAMLSEEC